MNHPCLLMDREENMLSVEKNCGFSFCYPTTQSVMLRKVSGAEDFSKRTMSEGKKNPRLCSCSFCHPLFLLLDFAVQEVSLQLSLSSTASAPVHTWSRTRPEGLTIVLIMSNFICLLHVHFQVLPFCSSIWVAQRDTVFLTM